MKFNIKHIMMWTGIVAIGCTSVRAALANFLSVLILAIIRVADHYNLIPDQP